jgi:phosphoesterase RecJ-like protein
MATSLDDFAKKFRTLVDGGRRFLIACHVRPDGDAYGSMLALGLSLTEMGKDVVMWNESGVTSRYRFLPGTGEILSGAPPAGSFDVRIIVDTATAERVVEKADSAFLKPDPRSPLVNIDHHISNSRFGDLVFVDNRYASCGEMVFDLLKRAKMPLTRGIADSLFVAITTDTGSFQYAAVTASTFRIAAELVDQGVRIGEICQQTYGNFPLRRLMLLREFLQTLQFDADGRIGWARITPEAFRQAGARTEDSEGFIDHIRRIDSVLVAVTFDETSEDGSIRISLRSKKSTLVDVDQVARKLGGGGHPAAAGAHVRGTPEEVQKRVLETIRAALPE